MAVSISNGMTFRTFTARPTRWEIGRPDGDDDYRTRVYIEDEGGGEYVEVAQSCGDAVRIDPDEWPVIRATIDRAMAAIAEHEREREGGSCP